MKSYVNKKYIRIPIGYHAVRKKMKFYSDNKLIFDLDVSIDILEPDYYEYLNVERFLGQNIYVECEPELEFTFSFSDEINQDGIYSEKYRPQIHFSSQTGWINDPNGLIYYGGEYHMFFQHNPVGNKWGNMHWGHAVSRDLIHWEQKETALYPDELGTMFSGSAIADEDNLTGLSSNERPPMLLYYTAAGDNSLISKGKPFIQCLAYSLDGGVTFEKYSGNPIVSHIADGNRDPKVEYCPELKAYLMALYLTDDKYAIMSSGDLIKWEQIQALSLQGDAECPDIYPLPSEAGQGVKWIFSGATDYYLIGEFTKGKFCANNPPKRLHYGPGSYAAQTFSGLSAQGRRIRIAWNRMEIPDNPFNCSMCFPTEMNLKTISGEEYLCAWPIDEIKLLYKNTIHTEDISVTEGNPFVQNLDGKAHDIVLNISEVSGGILTINLFGLSITLRTGENLLQVLNHSVPLYLNEGEIKLRIIADTLGAEIFADQGQAYICAGFLMDYSLNRFEVISEDDIVINEFTDNELNSIWTK